MEGWGMNYVCVSGWSPADIYVPYALRSKVIVVRLSIASWRFLSCFFFHLLPLSCIAHGFHVLLLPHYRIVEYTRPDCNYCIYCRYPYTYNQML